jgi:predicted MFS family arabinose efflux permease
MSLRDDDSPGAVPASGAALWWIALGLGLGPAVSNGLARFSYGLLLPAMRDDLAWTYTEAGWINTANAIGYLAGSVLALALVSRLGPRRLFVWGMALTALALVLSAVSRDLWLLSLWRIVAGIGGAPVFIAGGAMASAIFAENPARNALVIAVYFGGGGLGMLASGVALPPFLAAAGDAGWPMAWLMLGGAGAVAFVPSWLAARASPVPRQAETDAPAGLLPVWAMMPALVTYFLFGVGYLVYITFLIAWMQAQGAGPGLVATTWAVMGVGVMLSPFAWRRVLARARGGLAMGLTSLATGAGILLPLVLTGPASIIASAALFGLSLFMVPTSVTTFGRRNLPPAQWGASIALFTVIFSVGQILGPVGAGAVTDWAGSTEPGLLAAGLVLILGALVAALQRPLDSRPG